MVGGANFDATLVIRGTALGTFVFHFFLCHYCCSFRIVFGPSSLACTVHAQGEHRRAGRPRVTLRVYLESTIVVYYSYEFALNLVRSRVYSSVHYRTVYDHSQKGGFQITLIVLLCNKVNLCDCESQQNIGSV
jgi:hypothetical protein